MDNTSSHAAPADNHQLLKRQLSTSDVIFLIMANVIGVGIFLTPPQVANAISSPIWFLLVWLLGGLIALSGAMTSAELGVLLPRADGDYIFLKESYGKSLGFMYGYLSFTISFTGSVATLATGVINYQGRTIFGQAIENTLFTIPFVDIPITYLQFLPIVIIFVFTSINHYGLKNSITVQKVITLGPILILLISGLVIIFNVFFDHANYAKIVALNFSRTEPLQFPGFIFLGLWSLHTREDVDTKLRIVRIKTEILVILSLLCDILSLIMGKSGA